MAKTTPLMEKAMAWLSLSLPGATPPAEDASDAAPTSAQKTKPTRTSTRTRPPMRTLSNPKLTSAARRRPRDVHPPNALPAAVAALLANTDIPRHPCARKRRRRSSIISSASMPTPVVAPAVAVGGVFGVEPETVMFGPLELLLAPPTADDDDCTSRLSCDSRVGSYPPLSPTLSVESMSSVCDSLSLCADSAADAASDAGSTRSGRIRPLRQEREPLPPLVYCPLSREGEGEDEDEPTPGAADDDAKARTRLQEYMLRPLRTTLRSNISASLRVIKWAAREMVVFKATASPDDLVRGIAPVDPRVPYTDERRPPVSLDQTPPPPALRRYLNPTTTARFVIKPPRLGVAMNVPLTTYKFERPRSTTLAPVPASMRRRDHVPEAVEDKGRTTTSTPTTTPAPLPLPPSLRPREPRENPAFIRIAVLEMAMRRAGKLDEKNPGRARWALPPRKIPAKPYVVGEAAGVPARCVALAAGDDE
jgi:hypothetical protein